MSGGGRRTVLEPDHDEASLRQAQIEAVTVPRAKFRAASLGRSCTICSVTVREDLPRVAYVQRVLSWLCDASGGFGTAAGVTRPKKCRRLTSCFTAAGNGYISQRRDTPSRT